MIEFPFENYIELENNPYLLGRVTVHVVGQDYHCEVDIIHKESHKIFKHIAILYRMNSGEEAVNSGVQRLRRFLIEVEKAHEENKNEI